MNHLWNGWAYINLWESNDLHNDIAWWMGKNIPLLAMVIDNGKTIRVFVA